MTKGTDSRNIKQIVQSILQKYRIDDLALEIDIITAWMRYLNVREAGFTPAQTRARIASEFILGVSPEVMEKARIKEEIQNALNLDVYEERPEWIAVINHCLKQEKSGETIAKFAAWCARDPYNSPKKHQIALNPILIKSTWRSAFAIVAPVSSDERNPAGI